MKKKLLGINTKFVDLSWTKKVARTKNKFDKYSVFAFGP